MNPLRHIDPIGTVLVPALLLALGGFLFGWAKPVPVNAGRLRRPRQDMVWVAAAGPGSNLLMALGWALVLAAVLRAGGGTTADWVGSMASVGIYINLLLAVFNMLPIPPLDGGRVLTNLLPAGGLSRALDRVEPFGLFIVLGLVVTGILFKVLAGPIDWLQSMLLGLVGVRGY